MYYEEKKKNREKLIIYSCLVIIIALLAIIIVRLMAKDEQRLSSSSVYNAQKLNVTEEIEEKNNIDAQTVISNATNSIVGISKLKENGTSVFVNNAEEKLGLGSGVIVTDNGYIVTNQHVARKQI